MDIGDPARYPEKNARLQVLNNIGTARGVASGPYTGREALDYAATNWQYQGNVYIDYYGSGNCPPGYPCYPAGNFAVSPGIGVSGIGFTDPSTGNYRLLSTSSYKNQATDGTDPGVNQDALEAAIYGDTPPNALPSVQLTNPTNGQSFAPGQAIALQATATDPDGMVARVEFYANGQKIGEDTTWPYTLTWTPSAAGTYTLVARAVDNLGAYADSTLVQITVTAANQPPTCALTAPPNGSTFVVGQTVTITATATDPDGTVARVEFYVNNAKIGEDTSAPYSLNWTPSAPGTYALSARATDNSGATADAAAITVTVNAATAPAPPRNVRATVVLINGKPAVALEWE